jgi:hypothetical protein
MYFQDDWRVSPRLSINLGLRYEFNLPALNGSDQCADFNPSLPNPGASGCLGALSFAARDPVEPACAATRLVWRRWSALWSCLERGAEDHHVAPATPPSNP